MLCLTENYGRAKLFLINREKLILTGANSGSGFGGTVGAEM